MHLDKLISVNRSCLNNTINDLDTERYIVQFKEEYGVPKTAGDFERFQQGLMVITEG